MPFIALLFTFGKAKLNLFQTEQLGSINKVLYEKKNKEGYWEGLTSNYLKVLVNSDQNLKNKIINTKVSDLKDESLFGEILLR